MNHKFLILLSVGLFSYLVTMQLTVVLCQKSVSENFMVAETWSNYCPGSKDAIGTIFTKSRIRCAMECILSKGCIDFSYYATTGICNFYSYVSQKIFYDRDCTFYVARLEGQCSGTNGDYYGCLTLTRVNGNSTVCLAPPVQIGSTNIDLGSGPIPLPSVNNWIVIVQRFDGSLNFNRPWIDYKNGFGVAEDGEFWLGNENLYLLTNRPGLIYRLRVEYLGYVWQVQLKTSGRWYYADYATFSLDSESNSYILHLSGFSGNARDSLTNTTMRSGWYHGGMKFSTPDVDNDGDSSLSCGQKYQAGWWFNGCWAACLTCSYNSDFALEGLTDLEPGGILRAARMMIKSI